MSFIGPRPALYNQDDLIALRTEKGIHRLIPGVTGWAQVNGRDDIPIPLKVEYDAYYMNNRNIFMNLRILWMTFINVIRKRGIKH
jgi:O-antigen biosynthesis protein WbqP